MTISVRSAGIPKQIAEQIRQISDSMQDQNVPEIRALGRVQSDIVSGGKPDMSGLPEEMAEVVPGVLGG